MGDQERGWVVWARAFACAILFFFVIGSYYVVKSVREAVLVSRFAPTEHPKLYVLVCLVTLPVGVGIAALARRLPRQILLPAGYLTCGVVFLGFWFAVPRLAGASETWQQGIRAAYFVWVSVFILTANCLFWSFTNDLFTKEQGRRLYGLIGVGGIIGGVVGGVLAKTYAKSLGAFGLVVISAVGMAVCAALSILIHWVSPSRPRERGEPTTGTVRLADLPRIFASPYVALIAVIVVLHTFSETTVQMQGDAIQTEFKLSEDQYAEFRGGYNATMNTLAVVTQLLLVTWIHSRWGPKVGLLFLPVATLILAPLLLWKTPARDVTLPWLGTIPYQLAILSLVGIPLQAFSYSIWQASKELLYVPTDASVKYQAKALIDTFGFRFGDTLAALLALIPVAGVARVGWFATVGYLGCIVWMAMAWRVGRAFDARGAATPPASGTPVAP